MKNKLVLDFRYSHFISKLKMDAVKISTSEGDIFQVSQAIAFKCPTLKHIIEASGHGEGETESDSIPLVLISAATWRVVNAYLEILVRNKMPIRTIKRVIKLRPD